LLETTKAEKQLLDRRLTTNLEMPTKKGAIALLAHANLSPF
jgi:hypothetical protein